jgi:hypothetical protein
MSKLRRRWHLCCVSSIILCSLAAVSGRRRSDTVSASGKITLDGAALPTGMIAVIPLAKNAGPRWGARLSKGAMSLS